MNRNIFLAIGAVLAVAVFGAAGCYANAPFSGLIIGLMAAAGIVTAVIRNVTLAQMRTPLIWVATVILILTVPRFLIGCYSPKVNKSLDRVSVNHEQALANFFDKKSLKSEKEAGVFGVISESTGVYDELKNEIGTIKEGVKIKAADLEGRSATKTMEGMTRVILHNSRGTFVAENVVYVPSRKINWDGA